MGTVKYDYPPILSPGRHYLTLSEISRRFVEAFSGAALAGRTGLFLSLEQFIQKLLVAKIRCDVFIDGSFLTQKPHPDDVDVIVSIEHGVYETLSDEQLELLDAINTDAQLAPGIDCSALVTYPRDHKYYGTAADLGNAGECYGVEHGQFWLKGYIVVRLWEADVRNRLCR